MRILAFLLFLAIPIHALANPVSQTVVTRLNELPDLIVSHGSEDLRSELAGLFGQYGFGLLKEPARSTIEGNFDLFSSTLIDSQRPGFRVDTRLQDFFWSHADPEQAEHMAEALHSWVHAELSEAPAHGSMRVTGPSTAIQEEVFSERVNAALALASRDHPLSHEMVGSLMDSCAASEWNTYHPCAKLAQEATRAGAFDASGALRFVSEEITIGLMDSSRYQGGAIMLVESEYSFSRVSDANSVVLWYPVSHSGDDPKVESVSLVKGDSQVDLGYAQSDGGLSIVVPLAGDTILLRVLYRQEVYNKKAEYILTTTALWKEPLESAQFVVLAPSSYDLKSSLPLEKTAEVAGRSRYSLKAEGFSPDRDLVLTW